MQRAACALQPAHGGMPHVACSAHKTSNAHLWKKHVNVRARLRARARTRAHVHAPTHTCMRARIRARALRWRTTTGNARTQTRKLTDATEQRRGRDLCSVHGSEVVAVLGCIVECFAPLLFELLKRHIQRKKHPTELRSYQKIRRS